MTVGPVIVQSLVKLRIPAVAPLHNNGSLTFWGTYDRSSDKGTAEGLDGYAVGVMHTQQEFFGGFNKFMVQHGRGLGRHAGTGGVDSATGNVASSAAADDFDDADTFRIVNTNVIEMDPNSSMMTSFVYEDTGPEDFDGTDQT